MNAPHLEIAFATTSEVIQDMRESWRASRGEPWEFGLTLFESYVTIRVGDDELLDSVWTPLYPIARGGLSLLRDLPRIRSYRLDLAGTSDALTFDMKDDAVVVLAEVDQGKAIDIEYRALLSHWETFADDVISFIVREFPDVVRREDTIGRWFRKEE